MDGEGLKEILLYASNHLEYVYNPKESDSEEYLHSFYHLLPTKETYYSSIGAIKISTEPTLDKKGVHRNLYTVLKNLAHKFDGILCFRFDNNRNLVIGHL